MHDFLFCLLGAQFPFDSLLPQDWYWTAARSGFTITFCGRATSYAHTILLSKIVFAAKEMDLKFKYSSTAAVTTKKHLALMHIAYFQK